MISINDKIIQDYMKIHIPNYFPFDTPLARSHRVCHLKKAIPILNFLEKFEKKSWSINTWKYAMNHKISPSYLNDVIAVLNDLLQYLNIDMQIQKPRGKFKQAIRDAYKSTGKRIECDPLTEELLLEIKPKLRLLTYHFFYITFWLGLRPSELFQTKKDKSTFQIIHKNNCKVLKIYQKKLHTIQKEDRWKYIPILEPQQKIALELLEEGRFSNPSNLLLQKKALTSSDPKIRIRRYSGRKGFVPMMLKKGYSLEDLSAYLGHRNVAMSIKHYVDNETLQLSRINRHLEEK